MLFIGEYKDNEETCRYIGSDHILTNNILRQDNKSYYTAYENKYRTVYEQGIKYWSNFPHEINDVFRTVDYFFDYIGLSKNNRIIEFGCGEGYLAGYIASRGFNYTGIDISGSALDKAKSRCRDHCENISFIQGDITRAQQFISTTYNAAVDISCLHILVLDKDREDYLMNANKIISGEGHMLFCRELYNPKATDLKFSAYKEWLLHSGQRVDENEIHEAVCDGKSVRVSIPVIAARPRSIKQYREELNRHNFNLIKIISKDRDRISFIAQKRS